MGRSFHGVRLLALAFSVLLLHVVAASAQPAVYITGSAFADIKRFGSTQQAPYFGDDDEFSLDGTGAGGGLRIGTFLAPRWSLELSVDAGARTEGRLPNPYVYILAIFPPPPFADLELKAHTRFLAVNTIIGFHPAARGRVQLGYLVGFSFIRGTYLSDYVDFGAPVPLFTVRSILTSPITDLLPFPRPAVATLNQKQNTGGAILGFEAAVSLTDHIAVVPEIRALTFSTINRGPGVFLIRPGVGVRWNF
jgi:hypothetical protein